MCTSTLRLYITITNLIVYYSLLLLQQVIITITITITYYYYLMSDTYIQKYNTWR